jgi:GNAT superfamily N-acetyltransferase
VPERPAPDEARSVRSLPNGVAIRAARESDVAAIERLVREVVREVYGDLIPEAAPHRAGDWRGALMAEVDGRIVGVVVSDDDWVEDLWVTGEHRGRGVGSALLRAAERQIAARGHAESWLRVVARNVDARRFYGARGWVKRASYPHESWGFTMIEMAKELAP